MFILSLVDTFCLAKLCVSSWKDKKMNTQADIISSIEDILKKGNFFAAHNMSHEALISHPDNVRIQQLYGLSLARLGATRKARLFLEEMYQRGERDTETSGILGRVYKDLWRTSGNSEFAHLSRDTYLDAFNRFNDYYTGINAATMSLISGEREKAISIAEKVVDIIEHSDKGFWELMTLGEAYLLTGDADMSVRHYAEACRMAGKNYGDINSTFKQVHLISGYQKVPHELFALLKPPTVVAFAGHMIDRPARKEPRFPEELSEPVKIEIARVLDEMDAAIGYTSAACGADILFIEAMLERGAEVNALLPFSMEDFISTSVSFAGAHWEERFHKAIEKVTAKYITEEGYFGGDDLFTFTGYMIQGMSILRSKLLSTKPVFLTVLKRDEKEKKQGGTGDSLTYWPYPDNVRIIDPSECATTAPPHRKQPTATSSEIAIVQPPLGVRRSVKCILFADIVGFSKLQEEHTPYFMYNLLQDFSENLKSLEVKPEIINTWGDAIFAVYNKAKNLMEFALVLRNTIRETDWASRNLPTGMNIRIALHAGPVFIGTDRITNNINAYGAHINRTARMEPVTIPGCIYASEQFASMLAIETGDRYQYEYVGILSLPKGFGKQETYHIEIREGIMP
jgi:class 3 adenylate cyclase/tetratricopeptide (TPR) repeat protein